MCFSRSSPHKFFFSRGGGTQKNFLEKSLDQKIYQKNPITNNFFMKLKIDFKIKS